MPRPAARLTRMYPRVTERGEAVSGVRQVVVGVSGSPGNLPALRHAAVVARREHALLVPVLAWVPPGGDLAERTHPSPYLRKIWADDALARLHDALGLAWAAGPDAPDAPQVRRVVYRGEPGPALVELAGSGDDLIIVGMGRRGRLARLRHGGVSRYCLAHAQCPVICVPPPTLAGVLPDWSFRHRELTVEQLIAQGKGHGKPGQ
jgi:nucleotide-binding universal stress UspA family protein